MNKNNFQNIFYLKRNIRYFIEISLTHWWCSFPLRLFFQLNKHWKFIHFRDTYRRGGVVSWQYFIRSVRVWIGDRKGSTSAESCQHFTTGSKNPNATPGHGVHPPIAEEQCHAQAAPAPSPIHPSIGQTIGKRHDQFAAITSRQQRWHWNRIHHVSAMQTNFFSTKNVPFETIASRELNYNLIELNRELKRN